MDKPDFLFRHVGINSDNLSEAKKTANFFETILKQKTVTLRKSMISGNGIEIMHDRSNGTHGHIGFTVQSIPQAIEYLEEAGYPVNLESAIYTPDGKIKIVYLKEEIAGFAIHLYEEQDG